MLARRIPSALYVDFNNIVAKIVGGGFGDASAAWLAWLEDGQFDPNKRKRNFIQKWVYLDEPYLHFAKPLEANGFQIILSAADLIIALDLVESVHQQPSIKEYVLLSVDNDFQHLLERLGERDKLRVATIEPGAPCATTSRRAPTSCFPWTAYGRRLPMSAPSTDGGALRGPCGTLQPACASATRACGGACSTVASGAGCEWRPTTWRRWRTRRRDCRSARTPWCATSPR
jgi:hypothetical protein